MGRAPMGRFPLATNPTGAFGVHLVMDFAVPMEIAGTRLRINTGIPLSWSANLAADAATPLSWTGGVIFGVDAAQPLSWTSSLVRDFAQPLAFLQGVVVTTDSAMPLSFMVALPVDFAQPLAFEGTPFILGEIIRPATPTYLLVPQRPRGI